MENASKALLIAGGVMLAMMILSVMMYMSGKITDIGEAQNNRKAAEQLAAFNAEYEAYNKKLMYGTDVITAVNKAIEHNGGLGVNEADDFIDVKIKLQQDFIGVKVDKDGTNRGNYNTELGPQESLNNGTYNLRQNIGDTQMNETIIKFFYSISDSKKNGEGKDAVYYYDGITDFKRAIFECVDMDDKNKDGKIDYIEFWQKDLATF